MTVESAKNKAGPFNVTGASGTFPRDFLLLDEDHLRVIRVRDGEETDLTSGIGHTGIGTADGTVVISTGIQSGDQIYLLRAVPNLQRSDYNAQGRVRTEQVESDLDLTIMQVQDLREAQGRALTLPVSSEIGGEEAMAAALAAPQYAAEAKESAEAAAASAARLNGAIYSSRDELAAAAPSLQDGMTVLAGGEPYIIDSTATGYDSALQDLGVDGVRRADRLENLFLAAHFTTQDDTTIHISASLDGIHFSVINSAVLPGGQGFDLSQRDPSITYFAGWWWIFGTGGSAGNHDFVCFRSRDLSNWSKFQIVMAGGPYFSNTTPMPGGVSPASAIWAPEPFIENGVMHVMVSIRYGADFTNIYGAAQQHFRPYVTTLTDPVALTFSAPVAMDFGAGYPSNVRQWDQSAGAAVAPTTPLKHRGTLTADWGGFEMSLMEHLARDYPGDTILLVPAGKGSSGFSNSEWTSGGAARVEFAARLNAALAANPGATIEGMFWQQGEADRNNAGYNTALTDFLTYCRTTWAALATRPIIMGQMGTFVAPGSTDINAVIAAVAATQANYGVASSLSLTDKGDALHFDTNSYRTLGDRHYAAWRALRGALPGGSGAVRIFIIAGQSNAVGWGPAYTTYATGTSMIDPSVVKQGGRYYCAIKDSVYRRIRIYSAEALEGPWGFSQSIGDTSREIEAPCLVRVRDRAAINSEARRDKWRVYVDHNRTGITDPSPNALVGAPLYVEAVGSPSGDYGALSKMFFDTPVRHGSVVNLSELPPEASRALSNIAAAGGQKRRNLGTQIELGSGSQWIRPQQDVLYYASVNSGAVSLQLRDGPADRFYLGAMSMQAGVGIVVQGSGFSPRQFLVGFGRGNDAVIEMRRRMDGQYYPVGLMRRSEVRAHRGGSNQSFTAGTDTLVDWTTEAYDAGENFDLTTGRWTPPRGRVDIEAQVTISDGAADSAFRVDILKNGIVSASGYARGEGQFAVRAVLRGDEATGTDYYSVQCLATGTGSRTLNGNAHLTNFYGVAW